MSRAAEARMRRAGKEGVPVEAGDRPRRRDQGGLSVGSARKLRNNTNISRIAAGMREEGRVHLVPGLRPT